MLTTKDLGPITAFGRTWVEYDLTTQIEDRKKLARSGLMTWNKTAEWPMLWLFTTTRARDKKYIDLLETHPDWLFQRIGLKKPMLILTREHPGALSFPRKSK